MPEVTPVSVLHLHLMNVAGEEQGAFHHRVLEPIRLLSRDRRFAPGQVSWLAPEAPTLALSADILVVHALAGIEIEALIRRRKAAQKITMFEIGDHLAALTPWRRQGPTTRSPFDIARRLLHASLADGVQFSSSALQQIYASLNPHSTVLQNFVVFRSNLQQKPAGFTFGWAGTRSHRDDLATIAPAIVCFCERHPDAIFAIMGDPELYLLFESLPSAQFVTHSFGDYSEYRNFLGSLHVGVIPQCDTAFNAGRSDVKAIEMAAEGVAVLAQRCEAYSALHDDILLFESSEELANLLERLHADREELARVADQSCAALAKKRGEAATLAQHAAWYASWQCEPGGALPESRSDSLAMVTKLENAIELARTGDREGAIFAGKALIEVDPGYVQARWLVTDLLAGAGAKEEALEYGAPLSSCPIFGSLWHALAAKIGGAAFMPDEVLIPELRLAAENAGEDRGAYHKALLAAHPFHFFALAVEQKRLKQAGELQEASRLEATLQLIDPTRHVAQEVQA